MTTLTRPSEASEYAVVKIPTLIPSDTQSISDFRINVALQIQGEPAIFDAKNHATALVLAFATAYDLATQVILRLEDGRAVLIFDHESRDLLTPEPIEEGVWEEILKNREKIAAVQDVVAPAAQLTIDLVAIWNRVKTTDDHLADTRSFLKILTRDITPALKIVLQGPVPVLPLLAAVYLSRASGYTIEFQDDLGISLTLFS